MPNLKFSQFDTETTTTSVTGIVGYNTTANKNIQITPANFINTTGGPYLPLAGGTMTGDLKIIDNIQLQMGDGLDFRLYHDTNNSIISSGTGDLYIQNTADDKDILFRSDDGSGGVATYFKLDGSTTDAYFTNPGNVGIGTDSPANNLQVKTSSDGGGITIQRNSSTSNAFADLMFSISTSDSASPETKIRATRGASYDDTDISFITSNTEKMRIDSSGNVGIGTTSPGRLLTLSGGTSPYLSLVSNTTGGSPAIFFGDTDDDNEGRITYSNASDYMALFTAATERIRITSAGNVGIGTTSPSQKLDVAGNIQATGTRSISSSFDANHYIRIESNSSGGILKGTDGGVVTTLVRTYGDAYFNGGNVGIGTDSPGAKLDVLGSGLGTLFRVSNTTADATTKYGSFMGRHYTNSEENITGMLLTSSSSATGGTLSIGGGISAANAVNNIILYTAANNTTLIGTERMRINQLGNVGIGTTSPASKLDVVGRITLNDSQDNVLIGTSAGAAVTTGIQNTLIGALSGDAITTGGNNVALGYGALSSEDAHSFNVAIGSYSLYNQNADANAYNTAVGYNTGFAITTGIQNTLIGALSGDAITTGQDNVAMGYATLSGNVEGSRNVAIGRAALLIASTAGSVYNTAIGYNAGNGITTGVQNTILGGLAGGSLTTGQNNIIIGYNSVASAVDVDNEITLGNSSIATLRCQVTSITALSDERDKTSIEDLPYGLDFVNSLQPKKFVWDHRAETRVETDEEGNETQVEFYSSNKGKKDIGFIAQELQSVDNEFTQLVYNSNPEKLEATYGRLIPVLVKAIQDLSAKVTALENA